MLTELEPAPRAAVPLAEFAAHLRLPEGFGETEPALDLYARAATAAVEALTGRALIRRRFLWRVAQWRDGCREVFPVAPVASVEALELVEADGARREVDAAAYVLRPDLFRPALKGAGALSLPAIPVDGAAEVTFVAGHGADWNAVPEALRQAVLLLGAQYYEQRHVSADPAREAPHGVRALVAPWREVRL
ncbi:MAG: head-tail connector protein [Pseudomonadota bacterium]